MRIFTKKKVNELRKAGEIQAIIDLWEREKELNPILCTEDELKRLTHCQQETLKEHIRKGFTFGLSEDDINTIREAFTIYRPEYGRNNPEATKYPF